MRSRVGHIMTNEPPENPWGTTSTPQSRPGPSNTNRTGPRQSGGGGTPPPPFPPFGKFKASDTPPKEVIIAGAVIVGLLWIASGLYRVLPEENAVIQRFGKYMETVEVSGLHYRLPWPIESVTKPNVTFERRIEIGYRALPYDGSQKQDIPEESLMLTGDANIVDLDFVVQWKIGNAKDYLFNIRGPEETLKRVGESAMREVIGQNKLQDIITDRREDVAARVKASMQIILDSYGAGIMVTQVLIQDAAVPSAVSAAFEDVIRASQDAETLKNQATRYRNEIVPRAQGNAIRLVKEAEAYQEQVVSQAKGEAERFTQIYTAYSSAKDVTRKRLYLEAWDQILSNSNAIILDGKGGGGAVPYLDLNTLRTKNTEPQATPEEIR